VTREDPTPSVADAVMVSASIASLGAVVLAVTINLIAGLGAKF
jgi:hypothetical protein